MSSPNKSVAATVIEPTDLLACLFCTRRRSKWMFVSLQEFHDDVTRAPLCRMCIIFQQVLEAFMGGHLTETFKDITDEDERLELIEEMKVEINSDIVNRKETGLHFLRDAGTGIGALIPAAKIYIFTDVNDPDS